MGNWTRSVTLVFAIFGCTQCGSTDDSEVILIGEISIEIPPLKDFRSVLPSEKEIWSIGELKTLKTSRLHKLYIWDGSEKLDNSSLSPPRDDRWMSVQSMRLFEDRRFTFWQFGSLTEHFAKNFEVEMLNLINRPDIEGLLQQVPEELVLDGHVEEFFDYDIFRHDSLVLSYLGSSRQRFAHEMGAIDKIRVAGVSTVYVKGKIVVLAVYSDKYSEEDVSWVKATLTGWTDRVLRANGYPDPNLRLDGEPRRGVH